MVLTLNHKLIASIFEDKLFSSFAFHLSSTLSEKEIMHSRQWLLDTLLEKIVIDCFEQLLDALQNKIV